MTADNDNRICHVVMSYATAEKLLSKLPKDCETKPDVYESKVKL